MKKGIIFTLLLLVPSLGFAQVFNSALKIGSTGEEVRALQVQLAGMPGVYPEGLVTGYFGTLTERAVKKLQAQNGLEQVGFVGPKTRELLNSISDKVGAYSQDRVAPQVLVVDSSSSGVNSGYVFWTTNKFTTSEFMYANSSPFASTTPTVIKDDNFSFSHSVNISGLATSTTYYYMIKVFDERGNSATTTEKSFRTLSN